MAKRTVKVDVPIQKPDDFIKLLKKVVEKNASYGANSPLKNLPSVNMTNFGKQQAEAEKLRLESESLKVQSENKMEKARTLFGTDKGQTASTPGTLYNHILAIRDYLMVINKGNEEALSEWGFNVVVKKASTAKKKPAKP
jgi:hypothetical protein